MHCRRCPVICRLTLLALLALLAPGCHRLLPYGAADGPSDGRRPSEVALFDRNVDADIGRDVRADTPLTADGRRETPQTRDAHGEAGRDGPRDASREVSALDRSVDRARDLGLDVRVDSAGATDSSATSDSGPPATGWAKQFPGGLFTSGADLAVDASGNVYLTGSYFGNTSFGSGDRRSVT